MPKYFDAHSHLNFTQFNNDREEVLRRMKEKGVWTITVGTDLVTSKESVALAEKYDGIFATVGVHPTDTGEGFDEGEYSILTESKKVVGIGECGLDYFRVSPEDTDTKKRQRERFERQVQFALENNLPLMLHVRPSAGTIDAYEDALSILREFKTSAGEKLRGNSHFFVGDTKTAKGFLDIGFTVSFDGPITFTNEYDEVVRYVPLDMMLAETDAPFAAPAPHRGRRNEPIYISLIVGSIASIRGEDIELVSKKLVTNTCRVFGVDPTVKMRAAQAKSVS